MRPKHDWGPILDAYRAGEPVPELAARFGMSPAMVYVAASKRGIKRGSRATFEKPANVVVLSQDLRIAAEIATDALVERLVHFFKLDPAVARAMIARALDENERRRAQYGPVSMADDHGRTSVI